MYRLLPIAVLFTACHPSTNDRNLLNVWSADGRQEEHDLAMTDKGGKAETLEVDLDDGPYLRSQRTEVRCGPDADWATFAVRVYGKDGSYDDCAVFSLDPSGPEAVLSHGTAPATTRWDELNFLDCAIWSLL